MREGRRLTDGEREREREVGEHTDHKFNHVYVTEHQPSTGNQAAIHVLDSVIQQDGLSVWCAGLRGTQQCGQCEERRGKCVVVVVMVVVRVWVWRWWY